MKVGFIGVGTMGASMALNCMKGGNALSVFDARRDYRTLLTAHPRNVFLVKGSYWLSF